MQPRLDGKNDSGDTPEFGVNDAMRGWYYFGRSHMLHHISCHGILRVVMNVSTGQWDDVRV